jgi:hypothetical protein
MSRIGGWGTMAMAMALAASSCAHRQAAPQVSGADLGRLTPEQMGPIREARDHEQAVRQRLDRARLEQSRAQHALEAARADQADADADAKRASAASGAARDSQAPAAVARAQALGERARLHRAAADAHVEWATRLEEAWDAEVKTRQRELELAQARVDQSQLTALKQAGVPAAVKYDAGKFETRVHDASVAHEQARAMVAPAREQAENSRLAYEAARRQYQERTAAAGTAQDQGASASGTGTSAQPPPSNGAARGQGTGAQAPAPPATPPPTRDERPPPPPDAGAPASAPPATQQQGND